MLFVFFAVRTNREVCTQLMQALGGQRVALLSLDEFYRDLTAEDRFGPRNKKNEQQEKKRSCFRKKGLVIDVVMMNKSMDK